MVTGGLCYTVGAGFYARKTLFPHDLASFYPSGICASVHRIYYM